MKLLMRYILVISLSLSCVSALAQTATSDAGSPLESMLLTEATWEQSANEFMAKAKSMQFVWNSESKRSARSVSKGMKFLERDVLEVVATFMEDRLHTVLLSIYNKGDAAVIDIKTYEQLVEDLKDGLSKLTEQRPRPINSRRATSVHLKSETLSWVKGNRAFVLEVASSITRDPETRRIVEFPEYVNLTMLKGGYEEVLTIAGDQKAEVNLMALKAKITKTESGDVFLKDVPMVNQGQKGYCANATTERVMLYYGVEVNQHKLAQCARTAAGGGTSSAALLEALKAMAGMMYLRVNVMDLTDAGDLISMMRDYNRQAKKDGKPEIPIPRGGTLNMAAILRSMNSDTFVKSRTTNPAKVQQFEKSIEAKIDRGIPLMWSVVLGFVKETPALPQAFGGHMRLIIGYNSKTHEIIYTDTWGRGHEFKRMPAASASAITTGLFSMEPMH